MTKEKIQEKILSILKTMSVNESHYSFYLNNITPEALKELSKVDDIEDEFIRRSIIAKELFWGLGRALCNYVEYENRQY